MSQKSKKARKDMENTKDEELIEEILNDEYLLLERALIEVVHEEVRKGSRKFEEEGRDGDYELPPVSKYHKIRMNRMFRELIDKDFLPFPEVDNFYDRTRSKFIVKFKIHKFLYRRRKRRRRK